MPSCNNADPRSIITEVIFDMKVGYSWQLEEDFERDRFILIFVDVLAPGYKEFQLKPKKYSLKIKASFFRDHQGCKDEIATFLQKKIQEKVDTIPFRFDEMIVGWDEE